jgi:hypothetical protein
VKVRAELEQAVEREKLSNQIVIEKAKMGHIVALSQAKSQLEQATGQAMDRLEVAQSDAESLAEERRYRTQLEHRLAGAEAGKNAAIRESREELEMALREARTAHEKALVEGEFKSQMDLDQAVAAAAVEKETAVLRQRRLGGLLQLQKVWQLVRTRQLASTFGRWLTMRSCSRLDEVSEMAWIHADRVRVAASVLVGVWAVIGRRFHQWRLALSLREEDEDDDGDDALLGGAERLALRALRSGNQQRNSGRGGGKGRGRGRGRGKIQKQALRRTTAVATVMCCFQRATVSGDLEEKRAMQSGAIQPPSPTPSPPLLPC